MQAIMPLADEKDVRQVRGRALRSAQLLAGPHTAICCAHRAG
jgi:hypothetical protein